MRSLKFFVLSAQTIATRMVLIAVASWDPTWMPQSILLAIFEARDFTVYIPNEPKMTN